MTRIAIVGTGISGLGAAYALKDTADITVFEARKRLGGHAHTMTIDYAGEPVNVDVGFIVYNTLNYPNLVGLFDALGVATEQSCMSFSLCDPGKLEWASFASGFFAQKRNLFSPRFHRFWRTILNFNDVARAELAEGTLADTTLGAWLDRHGYDDYFRENYVLPMAAAIWSTPERGILDYPARSFFQFFDNHRLMHKDRPKWRTVTGGSKTYVSQIAALLGDRVRTGAPVRSIRPFGPRVRLEFGEGETQVFDEVILACHSDQARALLGEAYGEQRFLLGSVRYRPNSVYLHRDPTQMPKRRAAWASWNVRKQESEDVCLTYWMNRLQNLPNSRPLFITLNPVEAPSPDETFARFSFDHPQFDGAAEAAVRGLKRLQGRAGLWFAGAWMGRGFHEDGLRSGLSAALSLGGRVPWTPEAVEHVRREDTARIVATAKEAAS